MDGKMKAGLLVAAVLLLALLGALWHVSVLRGENSTLEERLQTRTGERDTAIKEAAGWKAGVEEKQNSIHGLQESLDSCLGREKSAMATADQWREILDAAQSRDMAPEEKGKVPDEATRRVLFDSLDRPL